jgi:hypothetical protein
MKNKELNEFEKSRDKIEKHESKMSSGACSGGSGGTNEIDLFKDQNEESIKSYF